LTECLVRIKRKKGLMKDGGAMALLAASKVKKMELVPGACPALTDTLTIQ
jgi:hypothetical protein